MTQSEDTRSERVAVTMRRSRRGQRDQHTIGASGSGLCGLGPADANLLEARAHNIDDAARHGEMLASERTLINQRDVGVPAAALTEERFSARAYF